MIWRTVAIFLVLLNGGVPVRGQNCQNQDQECKVNCGQEGLTLDGSGGNIVNVAFGKPATVSSMVVDSQDTSGPGCMLVNGRTSTAYRTPTEGNANCVHTAVYDYAAYWWVDLGRQYTITNITIYRREGAQLRMSGMSVLVENQTTRQTCYSFPNNTAANRAVLDALPEKIDITCNPPLTGSKVWLQKHGEETGYYAPYFINVCEVQVWACKDGLYGQNCAQDCSGNCNNGDPCNNYFGHCPAGCREGYTRADCTCGRCRDSVACDGTTRTCTNGCDKGWQPPYCNQTCPAGRYGDACAEQCGSCKNDDACNAETGICPNGCQPGKTETFCKEDCPDGFYGDGCNSACGNCSRGAACLKFNGTCPEGCQPGFDPSDARCKTPCSGNMYGENCGTQCGLCENGEACDTVTGHCSACQTSLLFPLCQVCDARKYGSSCDMACSALCGGDGSCDRGSSACVQGCVAGYVLKETSCEKCGSGLYGDGCGQKCGQCSGSLCRHDNGTCEAGCVDGFDGPMCKAAIQEGPDIGVVAGGAVAGVVVLLLVIAAVLFVVFRRSRLMSDPGARNTKSDGSKPNNISSTAAAERPPPDIPADRGNPYEVVEDDNHYEVAEEAEGRYINAKEDNFYDPLQTPDEEGAAYSQLQVPKKEVVLYQNQLHTPREGDNNEARYHNT